MRNLLAAMVITVLLCCSAQGAGPIQPFQYGLWSGGAYTDSQTGLFTHCAASVPYKSGIAMAVVVNRQYQWSLGFYDPQWSLEKGMQIPIELYFDGGQPVPVHGTVLTPTLVEVPMADNSQLISAFRAAWQMQAMAQGRTFLFNLNGTSHILPIVVNCVKLALAANSAVQQPSASGAPPQSSPSAAKLDEMRLATNFLLAARLSNAKVVSPTEVPASLASIGTVWKADGAAGAVRIIDTAPTEETGLDVASQLIASDAKACNGKFASARSSALVKSDVIFQAFTTCSDANGEPLVQYFITPWHKTGFAIFAVATSSAVQEHDADKQVHDEVFKKAALRATH